MGLLDKFEEFWGAGPFASANMREAVRNLSPTEKFAVRKLGAKAGLTIGSFVAAPLASLSLAIAKSLGNRIGIFSYLLGLSLAVMLGFRFRKGVKRMLARTAWARRRGLKAEDF